MPLLQLVRAEFRAVLFSCYLDDGNSFCQVSSVYDIVRSRLVSDSTTRDVEWEPIEEERLEEPHEGWMLGESKKRSTRISSRMLIVGLVPRGRVTLVKARVDVSSHLLSCAYVIEHKAKKVCHEEMVKMPLVDLKVLEVYTKSKEEHELHLKMNLELLKKEKYHVKPTRSKRSEKEAFWKLKEQYG
ncbi:hypothetical protein Tco_0086532 [Tanacetum coccineum]